MLKKDITYINPMTDQQETLTAYFHVSKREISLIELEHGFTEGGFAGYIRQLFQSKDAKKIIEIVERILLMGYGERSEDGKNFIKTPEITEKFRRSPAYDELFFQLVAGEEDVPTFIHGMMPKDVQDRAQKLENEGKLSTAQLSEAMGVKVPETVVDPFGATQDNSTNEPRVSNELSTPDVKPEDKPLGELTLDEVNTMDLKVLQNKINSNHGNVPRAILNIAFQRAMQQDTK